MTAGEPVRRAVCGLAAAAVLAAGAALLHSDAALAEAVQVWRGYYTLVVASDSPESVTRLEEAGLGPVVAAANARELVATFRGYEAVRVADLDLRLDPLDPRYDPYLRAVGTWFATGPDGPEASIVYVASALPPAAFAARAGRALAGSGGRWEIAGLPWRGLIVALLCFAVAAAALIVPPPGAAARIAASFRHGRVERRWRAALALPWLFLVAQGGLPAAFVALPAYGAAVRLAGYAAARGTSASARLTGARRAAPTARRVVVASVVAAAAAAAAGLALATPATALVATMARYLALGSLWSAALAASAALGRVLPPHQPSPPRPAPGVPVAAGASPAARAPFAARLAGAAALAAVAAALVLPAPGSAQVPRPGHPDTRAPVSLAGLARFAAGGGDRLPVLGDYVTHLAYQQTLAVGRPYRLPVPDERVTVDHYRRTAAGRVVREPREVARFDDEWLAAALAAAPPGSVAALLAAQGTLTPARRGPGPPRAAGEVALWIALAVLLCLWTIDPTPGSGSRAAPRRAGTAPASSP